MREISRRAGRGNISSSTVHNLFRSSRVPRWDFLEQVVVALGGVRDREDFLGLWQGADRAENDVGTARDGPASAMATIEVDDGTKRTVSFAARMANVPEGEIVRRLIAASSLIGEDPDPKQKGVAIYADYERAPDSRPVLRPRSGGDR
jgi:hypothetical protein